jgi:cytochrome c-type biogenesis protein CcmH/NrfG
MIERIALRFQNRWQVILFVVVILLATSPTPVSSQWIEPLNQASVSLRSGRIGDSLLDIEAALIAEPALFSLHLLASDLAFRLGEQERSDTHLAIAQEALTDNQIGFCRLARDEFKSGFEDHPSAEWVQMVSECTDIYRQVREMLLLAFAEEPDPQLLPYYESLLEAVPTDDEIHNAYALLLSVQNPDQAVEHLRVLSTHQPDESGIEIELLRAINSAEQTGSQAFVFAQIGQVFARFQNWHLAAKAFDAALSAEPGYTEAMAYLGLAKEQTGGDGYEDIAMAISSNPGEPRFHVFLAIHYQNRGETESAHKALDTAARLDPQNPAIAAQLGSIYAEIGDFSAATQAYLAATELAPNDVRFWLLLTGFSLEYDLDIENIGRSAARNAISVDPANPKAYELLGRIQFEMEDFYLSERSLRIALDLKPDSADTQYLYGLLMLTIGEKEDAEAAFLAASRLDEGGRYADLSARFLR